MNRIITFGKPMISWRLRHLMADRRISNKDLAQKINKHPNSIGNLKNTDSMPRIDGNTLNALCIALNCTVTDLIEFVPDEDEAA